jgi:hypothetical protein
MFKKFAINPNDFLGVLMDFSQSQREGFIDACQTAFGFTQARSLSYLKGCFMHWMQSVQRIKKNYALVPADQSEEFLRLVYKLRTCTSVPVFLETSRTILAKFRNTRTWLKWWLQFSVSSMIFNCRTVMKDDLKKHDYNTTNAIESYHAKLYSLIPTKQPLASSLRLILAVAACSPITTTLVLHHRTSKDLPLKNVRETGSLTLILPMTAEPLIVIKQSLVKFPKHRWLRLNNCLT